MERNKVTIVVLVSAFVILCLVLSIDHAKSTDTDSIIPSESNSKCWSPPARSLTKYFRYDNLDPMFGSCFYNIVGLPVNISWYSYGAFHGPVFLGTFYTDHCGRIGLDDIPRGIYQLEYYWNGEYYAENYTVSCCARDFVFENRLDAKGGDKALLFFNPKCDWTHITNIRRSDIG